MNKWGHTDRRRFPRTNKAIQVELKAESSDVPIRTETSDLCEMGCYVHMNITLELGTRVSLILWLDERKICGTGRVVTRHPQFGNGIELDLACDDRNRLRSYLSTLAGLNEP